MDQENGAEGGEGGAQSRQHRHGGRRELGQLGKSRGREVATGVNSHSRYVRARGFPSPPRYAPQRTFQVILSSERCNRSCALPYA